MELRHLLLRIPEDKFMKLREEKLKAEMEEGRRITWEVFLLGDKYEKRKKK